MAETGSQQGRGWIGRIYGAVAGFLQGFVRLPWTDDPRFLTTFGPAILLCLLVFLRSPASNFIFDEQEALLANPYVNGDKLGFFQVLERDFWGLPPTRSIGSYRPLPNVIWRIIWSAFQTPFVPHLVNVVVHAANASLVASLAFRATRDRSLGWLAGGLFLFAAVITEAVSGVVGLADVLGGLFVLLAVVAVRLPIWGLPFAVFGAVFLGLLSKESCIVAIPLLGLTSVALGGVFHRRPLRLPRGLLSVVAAVGALVAYRYLRRAFFPSPLPAKLQESLPASASFLRRAFHEFLVWFAQPQLPHDPINNPLVNAEFPERVAGALRVYLRGIGQVLLPTGMAGDYSYPQEPIPEHVWSASTVVGGLLMIVPPLAGTGLALYLWWQARAVRRAAQQQAELAHPEAPSKPGLVAHDVKAAEARRLGAWWLLAVGLVWFPVAYFPHSNIPVLLPTVRAERFWYLPVIGTSLVLAVAFLVLLRHQVQGVRWAVRGAVVAFFAVQLIQARRHAFDYQDDLTFWNATRHTVTRSAKAHLNYSVMVGARGKLDERLKANGRAKELAPKWPMAHIYYGDTLCRMGRVDEAWPHYVRGFKLGPNSQKLIALALQCLWDHGAIEKHREELLQFQTDHPGSWIAYLAADIVRNGKQHNGVKPQYRPRGYNEGPKE